MAVSCNQQLAVRLSDAHACQALKARGEPEDDDTTLGAAVMRLRLPKTGQLMPERFLKGNMATLLLGGYDTSAFTCTCVVSKAVMSA